MAGDQQRPLQTHNTNALHHSRAGQRGTPTWLPKSVPGAVCHLAGPSRWGRPAQQVVQPHRLLGTTLATWRRHPIEGIKGPSKGVGSSLLLGWRRCCWAKQGQHVIAWACRQVHCSSGVGRAAEMDVWQSSSAP